MRILLPLTAALLLSACADNPLVERTSRDIAKDVVNTTVKARFPNVDAEPYTDCIIDNATAPEILQLAQSALTQQTEAATSLVLDISKRRDTLICFASSQGPTLAQVFGG